MLSGLTCRRVIITAAVLVMAAVSCLGQMPPVLNLQPRPDVSAQVARGAALARAGLVEEAIVEFNKALKLDPQNRDARYNLGLALYNSSQFAKAITHFKLVLTNEPDAVDALKGLAFSYYNLQKYSTAAPILEKINRLLPGDAHTLTTLGRTYIALKQTSKALRILREAVQYQPGDAELLFELGKMELAAGNLVQARTVLQQALALRPESIETAVALGRSLIALKDPLMAIQVMRPFALSITASRDLLTYLAMAYEAAGDDENALRTRVQLAQMLPAREQAALRVKIGYGWAKLGIWPDALEQFQAAAALDPTNAAAEAGQGQAYTGLEMAGQAVTHWRRATELEPTNAALFLGLSGSLLAVMDFNGAETAARKALILEPGNTMALRAGAEAAMASGNYLTAENYLRRTLAVNPSDLTARSAVVNCLELRGDFTNALLEANELLALPKVTAEDYRKVAFLAEKLGNLELAAATWRRLMNLGGKDQVTACLELARILTKQHKAAEAADTCRRLLAVKADSLELKLALGRAQVDATQFDAAVKSLTDLLAEDPKNPLIWATWAEALAGIGKSSEAWEQLEQATANEKIDAAVCHAVMSVGLLNNDVERAVGILEGFLPTGGPQDVLLELINAGYRQLHQEAEGGMVLAHLYETEPGHPQIGLVATRLLQAGGQTDVVNRMVSLLMREAGTTPAIPREIIKLYLNSATPQFALAPLRYLLEQEISLAGIVAALAELEARPDLVIQVKPQLLEMAQCEPHTPGFWLPAADFIEFMGRSIQELARLEAMAAAQPDDLTLACGAAALALKQGRPQMAERILRNAQASRSADPGALRILARTLGDLQQFTEALNISQRVIAIGPARVSDYLDRTGWFLQMDKSQEAVIQVAFALRIDPQDPMARAWFQQLISNRNIDSQALFEALQTVNFHYPYSNAVAELMDMLAVREDARPLCEAWGALRLSLGGPS